MIYQPLFWRTLLVAALAAATCVPTGTAQSAEQNFYHAYFLEHARQDAAAALPLYQAVAKAANAPAELKTQARDRAEACAEDVVAGDLARLMPPDPMAYVELSRPAECLRGLLGQLGLLADGTTPADGENRLAISPAIVDALFGIRGVAAAVTGFDVAHQMPSGVAVIHPGDMAVVRGLIETALPAGTQIVEPIEGHPTYQANAAWITLTARLVIVGTSPQEIEGVIERLKDEGAESLANNAAMKDVLASRGKALAFFFVNPQPILTIAEPMLAAAAQGSREIALANALLDFRNFRAVSGRLDLGADGLYGELVLRLAPGHRNLVYNFLRRPAIDPATLKVVPSGAAAVVALAMNAPPAQYAPAPAPTNEPPVVTALDLGRELFANINGIAVFAMPPGKDAAPSPVPNVAAVITVNDPARSQALWGQLLGIASLAMGGASLDGSPTDVGGVTARVYRMEGGVNVHVATLEHQLLIGTSADALTAAIGTHRGGPSILQDKALEPALKRIGKNTTFAVLAHPARCIALARPYMSAGDLREIEPIAAAMQDTTALMAIDHSDQMLRVALAVSDLPNVGPLVSQALRDHMQGRHATVAVQKAMLQADYGAAEKMLNEQIEAGRGGADALEQKFELLAVKNHDVAGAQACAEELFKRWSDDAEALNNFAWALLTEDQYQHAYDDVALRFARRCNELTNHGMWAFVDTLALAEFKAGNAKEAVKLEEKAIELCRKTGGGDVGELEAALKRFRGAADGPH